MTLPKELLDFLEYHGLNPNDASRASKRAQISFKRLQQATNLREATHAEVCELHLNGPTLLFDHGLYVLALVVNTVTVNHRPIKVLQLVRCDTRSDQFSTATKPLNEAQAYWFEVWHKHALGPYSHKFIFRLPAGPFPTD